MFAVSIVVYAIGVGPMITLTATRRVVPLFVVQLARLAFAVAAVSVLSAAYGVTGAAAADLVTCVVATVAILIVQSWARRSVEGTQGGFALKRSTENGW